MPLKVDDIFEGYKVSKVVVTDLFKEIYTVVDIKNNKKEGTLVILLKQPAKYTYDLKEFRAKDCHIYSVPKYTFKDGRFFPSITKIGKKDNDYFICESLDKNLMTRFFECGGFISPDELRSYAYRMFYLLGTFQEKRKDDDVFYSLCPYDFYIAPIKKKNEPRLFLLNQNFSYQTIPAFYKKFDSIGVRNGDEPTLNDNAISICYILLFLYLGSLPWINTKQKPEEIKQRIEFLDNPLGEGYPDEVVCIYNLLKQLYEQHSQEFKFKEIAKNIKRMSGDVTDSSFLDTSVCETEEPSVLTKALMEKKKKEKERKERISSALDPTLLKKKQIKRSFVEMEQEEKEVEKTEVVEETTLQSSTTGNKRRKVWNSIRSMFINPALISSAILLGKFIYDHA